MRDWGTGRSQFQRHEDECRASTPRPSWTDAPLLLGRFGANMDPSTCERLIPAAPEKLPELSVMRDGSTASIGYRQIRPNDLTALQHLHADLFPIRYEPEFYDSVVHGKGIIAWAAVDTCRPLEEELVGFITARVLSPGDSEDCMLLGYGNMDRSTVYILTLGVVPQYRNVGIASALVWRVIDYAKSFPSAGAIYLHVISYNRSAILFYRKNQFQCLRRLRNFYCIDSCFYDAYVYAYYVNGGRPPWSLLDFVFMMSSYVRNLLTSWFYPWNWRKAEVPKWPKPRDRDGIGGSLRPNCLHAVNNGDNNSCV